MENVLKIGDKITDLSSGKQLLRMCLLEVYWSPIIGIGLILFGHLLPVLPAIILLFLYTAYAIRFIYRFIKVSGIIVTKDRLIAVGGFPEKVRKIIPMDSIEQITVLPNTIMGKCYSNTVTIEAGGEVICLRGYTKALNLKNLVGKIQKENS